MQDTTLDEVCLPPQASSDRVLVSKRRSLSRNSYLKTKLTVVK